MPIFVQWTWKERTKSFLVIFHFYDDGKKPNLRMKRKRHHLGRANLRRANEGGEIPEFLKYSKSISVMTWAPSHVELGLLSELLRYANLIDGLSEVDKRNLRPRLEGESKLDSQTGDLTYDFDTKVFGSMPSHKARMLCYMEETPYLCFPICVEYVDYLRNLLKPYLKD